MPTLLVERLSIIVLAASWMWACNRTGASGNTTDTEEMLFLYSGGFSVVTVWR